MPSVRLTLHAGDAQLFATQLEDHLKLKQWLAESGASYGLLTELTDLDDVGIETLESIYPVSQLSAPSCVTDTIRSGPFGHKAHPT